jgi:hypothetical protein
MIKKFMNRFRGAYFNAMFKIANKLFVGDKCPNCGTELRFNNNNLGKCQSVYCLNCAKYNTTTEDRVKAVWTFEELGRMPGFTRDIITEQQNSMSEALFTRTIAKKLRTENGEEPYGD